MSCNETVYHVHRASQLTPRPLLLVSYTASAHRQESGRSVQQPGAGTHGSFTHLSPACPLAKTPAQNRAARDQLGCPPASWCSAPVPGIGSAPSLAKPCVTHGPAAARTAPGRPAPDHKRQAAPELHRRANECRRTNRQLPVPHRTTVERTNESPACSTARCATTLPSRKDW